jgi:hypothetical protein
MYAAELPMPADCPGWSWLLLRTGWPATGRPAAPRPRCDGRVAMMLRRRVWFYA